MNTEPDHRVARTSGRAWTCRIVSFWGATRQPREQSNRSSTPTRAASDSSGGGLEEAPTTHHGEGDAATHQGDAGPEVSAGDPQFQVSLSDVKMSEVSLAQVSARAVLPPSTTEGASPPPQVASKHGHRHRVHEEEWRVRFDRLSRGRGVVPKAGSGEDLATTSKHARAQSAGQRGGMPTAPRYSPLAF
eukprot:scaffold19419_cov64-Phaeocystis_antarctica.AAC.2